MSNDGIPPDVQRQALEAARAAKTASAVDSLPATDVSESALGTGEASSPVNTPGYNPGYGGNWNPAPVQSAEVAPAQTPEQQAPEIG